MVSNQPTSSKAPIAAKSIDFDRTRKTNGGMSTEEAKIKFGKRIQRCYGCFVAFHLKDMYLGEDATYFCEHCKDETMFHFDDFSSVLDLSSMPSLQPDAD